MHHAIRGWLLVACLCAPTQAAWADGGMFPVFAGSGESADQRAVVVFDGARETLILQTAYEGDGSDFAWVIPVPEQLGASDIGTADPRLFDDLYYLTEPRGYAYGNAGGGCGCGGGAAGGQPLVPVRVWETLHVDNYQLAILSASDSSDLAAWLNGNGYAFPAGHEDELDYYVGKSWFFVAVKMSPGQGHSGAPPPPGVGDDLPGEEMRPLLLRFNIPEPVYPMRISAASSSGEVELLLYVIARHRVTSRNYNTEQVRLSALFREGDFGAYYDEQFRESLAGAGAGSLLVEYVGTLPGYITSTHAADLGLGAGTYYVTRLRSYLQPYDMQEDIALIDAPDDDDFQVQVAVAPAFDESRIRLAAAGSLFALAAVFGLASGRRDVLVRALLAAAVMALLLV